MGSRYVLRGLLIAALIMPALAIAPAAALAAANAVTQDATNVTSTSATFHGFVNPSAPMSSYHFEYGTSTSYGERTPDTPVTAAQNVSATVHDLFPGVTYHFRIVLDSTYAPGNNATGKDRVFTTPLTPGSIATTGDATDIKARAATLNGVVNTNDPNSVWFFQYGRTTAYNRSTAQHTVGAAGLTFVSSRIKNLRPRTRYHFRLVVLVPGQSRPETGNDKTFKTHKPSGKARLKSHRLGVSHGVVSIPWACSGPKGSRCTGRVSLSTQLNGGPATCASGKLNMSARHTRRMQLRLRPACRSALKHSHGHHLHATLRATFTTDQNPIRAKVTLNGT